MPFGRRKSNPREMLLSAQHQLEESLEKEKRIDERLKPFHLLERFVGKEILIYSSRNPGLKKKVKIKDLEISDSGEKGWSAFLTIEGVTDKLPLDLPRSAREEGNRVVFDYSADFDKPDRGKKPFELEMYFESIK